MRLPILALGLALAAGTAQSSGSVHDFTLSSIDGQPLALAEYRGKVLLIVNVASRCGYTPQYAGLEALYQKYKSRGLVIIGVPANDFGGQEPGSNEEIKMFCSRTYNVTFPLAAKASVKGKNITPLYAFLTGAGANPAVAGEIRWNFTKFLIGRDGAVLARFEPQVEPQSRELIEAVERALAQPSR